MKKKSDTSTISFKPSDQKEAKNVDEAEELEPPFDCDECNYNGISKKGLLIHKGKKHKIGAQIDGQDDCDIKEDASVQTDDSLLIVLHGDIAEDCEDEYIGETFWRLPKELYFDHFHTNAVRRAPEGCWMNRLGEFRNRKTGEVLGKVY